MDLSESDFHNLRREQALLVDFQAFPQNVIELLDLCLVSAADTQAPK